MKLLRALRSLFQKGKLDAEMAEEMRAHIELQTERNIAAGMDTEEARYAALRQFGNVASIQEQAREARGWPLMDQGMQDLRYASRQIRRNPGFAVIAILSLAVAIGANTSIFSLYHEVLVKPLPVVHPEQLVHFRWIAPVAGFKNPHPVSGWSDPAPGTKLQTSTSFSLLSFEWFRDHNGVFSDVFAFAPLPEARIRSGGVAEISPYAQMISGGYCRGLGLTPAVGRLVDESDDRAGAAPVAVLSDRYWRLRFAGDPAIIGQTVEVNDVPCEVIGVMPPQFTGTLQVGELPDVFVPLTHVSKFWPQVAFFMGQPWRFWFVQVMGRLRPEANATQAQASLEDLFRRSALDDTASGPAPSPDQARLVDEPQLQLLPGARGLFHARHTYAQPIGVLQGLAAMVLVIACMNVANLLLSRAAMRRREIATRLALGASRGRIVRQLLLESSLLTGGAILLGNAIAWWGKDLLVGMQALGQPASLVLEPRLDLPVLGFTAAVAFLTTILFGLIPAWQAVRLDLRAEFAGGTRGPARPAIQLSRALMVLQVAVSLMVLLGAGLFVRSLQNLRAIDPGFNQEQLLLFRLDGSPAGRTPDQLLALYREVAAETGRLPSVKAVAWSSVPLLSDARDRTSLSIVGDVSPTPRTVSPMMNIVTEDFFTTLQMRPLAGRTFSPQDAMERPPVAVINETLERELFGPDDPLGRQVVRRGQPTEIVGVVNDARYADVREPVPPTIYFSATQNPPDPRAGPSAAQANFTVRTAGEPDALLGAIRAMLRNRHPDLPMFDVRTQVQAIDRQLAQPILFARLSGSFATVVAALVAVGLYGLISYSVFRRTAEIGVRMALGAQIGDVMRMLLRDSIGLALLGVLLGVGGALATARYLGSRLYGITATDLSTYMAAVAAMLTIAAIACWLPARRAARVDPMVALRAE